MNFDGESLVQPRLGIHWNLTDTINLHGGVGLYSGGNPNVWLSNNYSNDGITQVEDKGSYFGGTETLLPNNPGGLTTVPSNGDGRPLWNIPQPQVDGVASGTSNGGVNAIDPSFKIPSAWKFALGMTWDVHLGFLGDDYVFGADYMLSRMNDAAIIVDSTLVKSVLLRTAVRCTGTSTRATRIVARSARLIPTAAVAHSGPDYILSNTIKGENEQQSFSLSSVKSHDFGLDWTLGYTYNTPRT